MSWSFLTCQDISLQVRINLTSTNSRPYTRIYSKLVLTQFRPTTLVTPIDNPFLLLATLPLYHPVQDLKMTPLFQFTPVHFLKSTPLPLLTPVCNFEALLGASLISMNQQVLLRPGTPVL